MAIGLIGISVALIGFYGPMGYAASHRQANGWHDLIMLFIAPTVGLLAIGISMILMFVADRISNPDAIRDWQLERTRDRFLLLRAWVVRLLRT